MGLRIQTGLTRDCSSLSSTWSVSHSALLVLPTIYTTEDFKISYTVQGQIHRYGMRMRPALIEPSASAKEYAKSIRDTAHHSKRKRRYDKGSSYRHSTRTAKWCGDTAQKCTRTRNAFIATSNTTLYINALVLSIITIDERTEMWRRANTRDSRPLNDDSNRVTPYTVRSGVSGATRRYWYGRRVSPALRVSLTDNWLYQQWPTPITRWLSPSA